MTFVGSSDGTWGMAAAQQPAAPASNPFLPQYSPSAATAAPPAVMPTQWLVDYATRHFTCGTCSQLLDDPVVVLSNEVRCRKCVSADHVQGEVPNSIAEAVAEMRGVVLQLQNSARVTDAPSNNSSTSNLNGFEASSSVMAQRKIVKVKRSKPADAPATPPPNHHNSTEPGSASKTFFHVVTGADGSPQFEQQQQGMAPLNPNVDPGFQKSTTPNAKTTSFGAASGSPSPLGAKLQAERQLQEQEMKLRMTECESYETQLRQELNGLEGLEYTTLYQSFHVERRKIASRHRGSRQFKNEADAKYESTEYQTAIELYTKAIECQPTDHQTKLGTIYGNRSAANYMAGRYEEAIQDCEKTLQMDPTGVKMLHRAAKSAIGLGDLPRADAFLNRIPQEKMDQYRADRDRLDSGMATLQAAEAAFGLPEGDGPWTMLVAHYPEVVPFRVRLASHLAAQEQYSKAAEALTFFVGSNRTSEVAYHIAKYQYFCGFEQFKAARDAVEPFANVAKNCADMLQTIRVVDEGKQEGNLHFSQKRFAQAVDCYTRAIDVGKDNNATLRILYCNRAAAYKELGRNREGADDCTKAIRIAPDFSKAYARRARCLQNLGDHMAAVKDFKQAVRFESSDRDLQKELHHAESLLAKEAEKEKDIYYVLNVPRTATDDVIRARYKELVLKWHPDKCLHLELDERNAAEHKFKLISSAYTTLLDPAKRREYDLKQDIARDRMSRPSSFSSASGFPSSTSGGFGGRRGPGDMPGRTQNFW